MGNLERFTTPVVLAAIAAFVFYFLFYLSDNKPAPKEVVSGWDDLIPCSELTSFNGKKKLVLSADGSAKLEDGSGDGEPKRSSGRWSLLSARTHRYAIDIPDLTRTYIAVSPPDSDGCVFAFGTVDNVNLRLSWFSMTEPVDYPEQ